jgi:hypothetical protein
MIRKGLKMATPCRIGYEIQAGIEIACLIHILPIPTRGGNSMAARDNTL